MSEQYSIADLADQDILDIGVYLSQFGISVTDRMIDRLHAQFSKLAAFPGMGKARDDIRSGLRSIAVDGYVVFYLPVEDGVRIIRVLHGSRDIDGEFR